MLGLYWEENLVLIGGLYWTLTVVLASGGIYIYICLICIKLLINSIGVIPLPAVITNLVKEVT